MCEEGLEVLRNLKDRGRVEGFMAAISMTLGLIRSKKSLEEIEKTLENWWLSANEALDGYIVDDMKTLLLITK